jgi:sugar/nucleoside kinase (ribokinase family)
MADVGSAGILVADMFCGPLDALPAPGELLALDSIPAQAGGCAANVAIGLIKQGISADVIGCVGRDAPAQVILKALENAGVSTGQIADVDENTSQTVILLVKGEDRRYLHVFGANKIFSMGQISRDWLRTLKVFYLGGVYVMPGIDPDELADTLRFCRENSIITLADVVLPKTLTNFDDLSRWLPYVDYFVPNDDEARQMTGLDDARQQANALLALGARSVIITGGERGLLAVSEGKRWQAGIYHVDSIDMTGSGDGFTAGLIAGILRGWDLPQSLRYASALGASATLAIGTTPGVFTVAQAEEFMQTHELEIIEA